MKKLLFTFFILHCSFFVAPSAYSVGAGTVGTTADSARVVSGNPYINTSSRGYQANANTLREHQKNTYFMVTQPDVDTECRKRIYNCLSEYCGDVTAIPGQREGRCQYATESELYNYALLCLQKDTSILLPQYTNNTSVRNTGGGMNTAARLCPSYVQQELMSYLSMSNMATQLSKSHSDLCLQRRQELEAAMSCHSTALMYGNETSSRLNSVLTDYCGNGVPGGSSEMVTRFASAGNVGANIWGWAEKIVNLDLNQKGAEWQAAVDTVLAGYTNRMNLACGDNMQVNVGTYPTGGDSNQPTALQTAAALVIQTAFPGEPDMRESPWEAQSLYMDVYSLSDVWTFADAKQVINAAMTNPSTTPNSFLSSGQMESMQQAYRLGTKVFVLRDSARCYIIPVASLDSKQQSLMAQSHASCISR